MSVQPHDGAAGGSCLYLGRVMHRRLRPCRHRFAYRVFSLLIDIDELPDLNRRLRLLRHNRAGLLGIYDRDHGPRDGTPLRPWIDGVLSAAGIDLAGGKVRLLCFPRLFGYVFNPLSVWFCHRRDGRLAAVLYEVSNTFGEHHHYLVRQDPPAAPDAVIQQQSAKAFYVSPFCATDGDYGFRLRAPGARLSLAIRYGDRAGDILVAVHTGERRDLTDRALAGALIAHPLMTIKVIAAIHWQALQLWMKGVPLVPRPGIAPPASARTRDLATPPGAS